MPYEGFRFGIDDVEQDIARKPAFSHFVQPHFATPLIEASIQAYEAGAEPAILAPVLWYGIETGIRTLKIPSVRDRMPEEVTLRSLIAERVGHITAEDGWEQDLFVRAYRNNELLSPYLDDNTVFEKLTELIYLQSFMAVPWSEASQVIAGGYAALVEAGAPGDIVESVATSRSLQTIALLPAERRNKEARDYLGWPYALTSHFKVGEAEDKPTIAFNRDAVTFLGSLMIDGRGCSAADIRLKADLPGFKGTFPGTLLRRAFELMTRALLQGEPLVTTDAAKLSKIVS